jgi:hypothetical protein
MVRRCINQMVISGGGAGWFYGAATQEVSNIEQIGSLQIGRVGRQLKRKSGKS